MLEVLNQQFAQYALNVTLRREQFIEELEALALAYPRWYYEPT